MEVDTTPSSQPETAARVLLTSPIAHPLAEERLSKKLLKTVKKAAKQRHVKRGVREVVKALRKGEKGMVVLAGDISPIDVISHLPVLCEDNSIPYCFVPSKEDLGAAGRTKRPTSCVMIVPGGGRGRRASSSDDTGDYQEGYDECRKAVLKLNASLAS
ncbi:50S ribosomal protein L30e-like protein [Syncephalis pseudoplumigaleata]|uniref:H/ACA ribonucleoprotein complex subunit 2 n=1 Tax=Syncephalis pseudoplumigaleata TaxID=1712513 RepID=A0A4P9Z0W2_9FUNG|nr:50S ribosomal protein L30e-like protein [Syncephalis pseudoplumigaleata]RKP26756.1 50S ribosomal protein L30e-like protein [Syncephalis pseudoplumigaleata]|eukprot:RKP25915.1 50S ribosomal protein L30e-like protein [Syncephalis pseudoplumigaleata]